MQHMHKERDDEPDITGRGWVIGFLVGIALWTITIVCILWI